MPPFSISKVPILSWRYLIIITQYLQRCHSSIFYLTFCCCCCYYYRIKRYMINKGQVNIQFPMKPAVFVCSWWSVVVNWDMGLPDDAQNQHWTYYASVPHDLQQLFECMLTSFCYLQHLLLYWQRDVHEPVHNRKMQNKINIYKL